MADTGEKGGKLGTFLITLAQVLPASWVTWRLPSSVPAQMIPAWKGDSWRLMMVQWFSAEVFSGQAGRPAVYIFSGLSVVRSGLMTFQVETKSVDLKITYAPR